MGGNDFGGSEMEIALTIVAILAGGLVIWAAPAVIMQHRIDKAFKRIGLSVQNFSYSLGQVKFAIDGATEALHGFVYTWNRMGYDVEDQDGSRRLRGIRHGG